MSSNPEPAVGQVWWFKDEPHPCIIEEMICSGTVAVVVYPGIYEPYDKSDWSFSDATYLGTLDELREHQALREENVKLKDYSSALERMIRVLDAEIGKRATLLVERLPVQIDISTYD